MGTLRRNISALVVLQGANYLLPLTVIPYLLRVLGPENYGRIAFAQAFVQYFVMLTGYGFDLSATRDIAHAEGDLATINRIFNAVLTVKFLTATSGFAIMSVIVLAVPGMRNNYALFAVCYLAVIGNMLFPVWLYQGVQRMGYITVFMVSSRALVVLAVVLFVRSGSQILLAAGLLVASSPLAGTVALWYARRVVGVRLALPRWTDMKGAVLGGWHVFTATFGGALYNSSSIFVLGLVVTPVVVGYFAAADKLVRAAQSLVYPVSQAVFPHMSVLLKSSRELAFTFLGKVLSVFFASGVVSGIILALGAGVITPLAFGPYFAPSADIVRLLSLWPLLIALNLVMGAQFIVQLDLGRLLSVSILVPALLHVALLYPVAHLWGASGVAVLMMITELLVLIIRIVGLSQKCRPELVMLWRGLRWA